MSSITPKIDLFADIPKRGPGRPRKPVTAKTPVNPASSPTASRRSKTKKAKPGRKGVFDKKDSPQKPNSGMVNANINLVNKSNIVSSVLEENPVEVTENLENMIKSSSLKDKLTSNELQFINYHLSQGMNINKAMILAGYTDLNERWLYYKAKNIIQRYEAQAEDRRNIMRALGIGETAVIRRLWHEAQTAGSAGARVQALIALGKWLGMDQETLQAGAGITVIIQALDGGQQQINLQPPGQAPTLPDPGYRHPGAGRPEGPITITK